MIQIEESRLDNTTMFFDEKLHMDENRSQEGLQETEANMALFEEISKKIDEIKEKKDSVEKQNDYFLAVIEELQEEKAALQKQVAARQEMRMNVTQAGKLRREKTTQLLELEELKEKMSFLKRQQLEVIDMVGFLQDSLHCSRRVNNNFSAVLDKLQEEINALCNRQKFLKERQKVKPSLWQRFCRFFCPRKKEGDEMSLLVIKMNVFKATDRELKDKLQYVKGHYYAEVDRANALNEEIQQLEGKLDDLKKWLQKDKMSIFKRGKDQDDKILKKQKSEIKKRLEHLKWKLMDIEDSADFYQSLMTKFQQEEAENIQKIKHIDDVLLNTT